MRFKIISCALRIIEPVDVGVPIRCRGIIVLPMSNPDDIDFDPIETVQIRRHNAIAYLDTKKVIW